MIKDLGDLDKLLKLCRKRGVTELKLGGVELKLGDLPAPKGSSEEAEDPETPDAPTLEQLAFFSAGEGPI